MKSPQVLGKEQEGLYILKSSDPTVATSNTTISKFNSFTFSTFLADVFTSSSSYFDSNVKEKMWHYRLGHMSMSNMKKVFPISTSCSKFSSPCIIYPMARQSKLPFPSSNISTTSVFEFIYVLGGLIKLVLTMVLDISLSL